MIEIRSNVQNIRNVDQVKTLGLTALTSRDTVHLLQTPAAAAWIQALATLATPPSSMNAASPPLSGHDHGHTCRIHRGVASFPLDLPPEAATFTSPITEPRRRIREQPRSVSPTSSFLSSQRATPSNWTLVAEERSMSSYGLTKIRCRFLSGRTGSTNQPS
ncbi:hypothetical protein Droror1_Dr00011105 [Drosera rotundifolia]